MNTKPFLLLFALAFAAPDSARAQQWTREQVQQWAPQAQHWTEAQWQEFNRATRCAYRNTTRLRSAGDPRVLRMTRETQRRGGTTAAALTLQNTRDWRSVQRDLRACR
jgi:hypothetical protein